MGFLPVKQVVCYINISFFFFFSPQIVFTYYTLTRVYESSLCSISMPNMFLEKERMELCLLRYNLYTVKFSSVSFEKGVPSRNHYQNQDRERFHSLHSIPVLLPHPPSHPGNHWSVISHPKFAFPRMPINCYQTVCSLLNLAYFS